MPPYRSSGLVIVLFVMFCNNIAIGNPSNEETEDLSPVFEKSFSEQLCEEPPPPYNGDLHCGQHKKKKNRYVCKTECNEGFQFPNGKKKSRHFCDMDTGLWTPDFTFPDCQPICEPPCENSGECSEGNHCICTPDYRGIRCQYDVGLCDPRTGLVASAVWSCNHTAAETVCVMACPQSTRYESTPADLYLCSLNGSWTPETAPKCLSINIIEPPSRPGLFPIAIGQAPRSSHSDTCATWGATHVRTFDGGLYTFQGGATCTHVLVKDCATDDGSAFSVHLLKNTFCEEGDTTCGAAVVVLYVGGHKYVLYGAEVGPVVKVDEEVHAVPTVVEGVVFQMVAGYVAVTSASEFSLKWDQMDTVLVKVFDQLKNKTCGLCGRFDGTVLNDFERPDGSITDNVEEFVNSWTMEELGESCKDKAVVTDPCSGNSEKLEAAEEACKAMFDKNFDACHDLLDPKIYYEYCKMDLCACSSEESSCHCSTLTEYFTECLRLGGKIEGGWRNADLCPLNCSEGMVYSDCGSHCPRTCRNTVYHCEEDHCVDGCHCPDGSVLHGGRCVQQESCPCLHKGVEHKTGDRILQDCNACECNAGHWECTKKRCDARCSSTGDPHYTTFDGLQFEHLGTCPHYLVHSDDFSVVQDVAPCSQVGAVKGQPEDMGEGAFCTQSVTVTYNGSSLVMRVKAQMLLDEREIASLPLTENGFVVYMATSIFTKVELPNNVSLLWDGQNGIYIDVTSDLENKTKGLCGTFNRNQKDDFLTPDGDLEADVSAFAARWAVSDSCRKRSRRSSRSPCQMEPQKAGDAERLCSVLKSDVFKDCHDVVDPGTFYRGCVSDMCACHYQDFSECLCPALNYYSSWCASKGVIINWVNQVSSCKPRCPGGQEYSECASPCTSSCAAIAVARMCVMQCVQGCACPSGMTLNDENLCVTLDQCPCVYEGKEYPPGSRELQGTSMCECENARWECREALPTELNSGFGASRGCDPEKGEQFAECPEECPRSCQNLHLPACKTKICIPGCSCKSGLVKDTDSERCVEISECGCRHGGRKYTNGDTVKKDCNLCTCQQGTWQCTDEACAGVCSVWGQSHFKTFDGRAYEFQGHCEYVLAKGMSTGAGLAVTVQSLPCSSGGATCSWAFTLEIGRVADSRTDVVHQDSTASEKITLTRHQPVPKMNHSSVFVVFETGLNVFVHTSVGASLQWDRGTRLYLTLDPRWRNKVQGLCGNYNDDQQDDFLCPWGGVPETRAPAFADSWRVLEFCPSSEAAQDHCAQHRNRESWAEHECKVLKSELFQPCHSEVSLDEYYERCVSDTCACDLGGDCECLCTAIAAYVQECNTRGVHIKWRSQELCPIQCEDCATYESCIPACPLKTCENQLLHGRIQDSCSKDHCVEGCRPKPCPDGQIFNNSQEYKCIPVVDCVVPCLEINGRMYNEGERVSEPGVADPCQSCHCRRGAISCTGSPCPVTEPRIYNIAPPCTQTGWTPWMNTPPTAGGDTVLLDDPQLNTMLGDFCGRDNVTGIECRVATSKVTHKEAGQNVLCDLARGLVCEDRRQGKGGRPCEDYEIRLFCDCGLVTPPAVCVPGWTGYYNVDHPTLEGIGDEESIENIRNHHDLCVGGTLQDVECKALLEEKMVDYSSTGQFGLKCSKSIGFICNNFLQPRGEICFDYAVRFFCSCEPTTVSPTTTTMSTTILPTITPIPETCGWTPWLNVDKPDNYPDDEGDIEDIGLLQLVYKICGGKDLSDIECRMARTHHSFEESHQKNLLCDLENGFRCYNKDQIGTCYDYEVRVLCLADWCQSYSAPYQTEKLWETTTNACPDGQVYDECAYNCSQTCSSFAFRLLVLGGHCDGAQDRCVPGCRPVLGCRPPLFWRDHHTCVPREQCTCVFPEGLGVTVAPHDVIESGCEKCQCIDDSLMCYPIPGCGQKSTTSSYLKLETTSTTLAPPVDITNGDCWTDWVNTDSPFIGAGDFESLTTIRKRFHFCDDAVEIQCRPVILSEKRAVNIRQTMECNLRNGLTCWNSDNVPEGCYDYEVRFFCPCTTEKPQTTTSTPTTSAPAPCHHGWTEWYNSHTPDVQGEYESVQSVRSGGGYFCANDEITAMDCKPVDGPQGTPLQRGVTCEFGVGLVCKNVDLVGFESCQDYAVRFFCDCPTEEPSTPEFVPPATAPARTTRLPQLRGCAFWSDWINDNHPRAAIKTSIKKGVKGAGESKGDIEKATLLRLQQQKGFCLEGHLSDIECRDAVTDQDYTGTSDRKVVCSLASGFRCRAQDQYNRPCRDYKIRYFCECEASATTIILRPTQPTSYIPLCNAYYEIVDGPNPLPDSSLIASSSKDTKSGPQSARLSSKASLKSAGAWMAGLLNDHQYLEVDLGSIQPVYGVVTRGRNGSPHWVTTFKVLYSRDRMAYAYVSSGDLVNSNKIFPGNFDSDTPVENTFDIPFEARYVRIQPITYHKEIALRMDILLCAKGMSTEEIFSTERISVCRDEMGLSNGHIYDFQISTTSDKNLQSGPDRARLYTHQTQTLSGGWVAKYLDDNQYVQVDLLEPRTITGITTQGREAVPQFVTAFTISYSEDGALWYDVVDGTLATKRFPGNHDSDTPVTSFFPKPIRARLVRIHPLRWNNWISMRLELLGCYEPYATGLTTEAILGETRIPTMPQIFKGYCEDPMGFESGHFPDELISVSSSAGPRTGASRIRLNTPADARGAGGWAAATADHKPVIEVDFYGERNITGILTQGRADANMWIKSYTVEYSLDHETWYHIADSETKNLVFDGNNDRNTPVLRLFTSMITARYLKITLLDYHNLPAMRMEILGCYKPYVEEHPPTPMYITPTEFCIEAGPWMSLSDPASSAIGDEEPIDKIIAFSGACSNPVGIECREMLTRQDHARIGQLVSCDLDHGLRCENRQQVQGHCYNYEVRIKCWSCGGISTASTTQTPLHMCPELPESLESNCPRTCPHDYQACDGSKCLAQVNCPCFRDGNRFNPGDVLVTETCQWCECSIQGHSRCKPIECDAKLCQVGQKSKLNKHCECDCVGCPAGTLLCSSSGQCVKEDLWCDGVVDCPDDEINCPTTLPPTTAVPTTTELPITCSTDDNHYTDTCYLVANTIETFDGLSYQYEICDHILMKEKLQELYFVSVHKSCLPHDATMCRKYLKIKVDDLNFKIGPGSEDVSINDVKVLISNLWLLSRRFQEFELKKEGNHLVFRSFKYYFDVTWDAFEDTIITISQCAVGQIVGLCGLYNKKLEDDRTMPNGDLAPATEIFGDSWSVGSRDRCLTPKCPLPVMTKAVEICDKLVEPPFDECLPYLKHSVRVEACVSHMCDCLQQRLDVRFSAGKDVFEDFLSCHCSAYESYAEACETAKNGSIAEWRIKHDCTPHCPAGMEWQDCGAGCDLTCDNYRQRAEICSKSCVPGCYCPSGLLHHRNRCVKPKMCQDCICRGHGDPNYITFDGHYYAFQGNCTYILAQHQSSNEDINFQVLATNYECPEEPGTSCVEGLKVIWNGHVVEKFYKRPVFLDGSPLEDKDTPFDYEGISISFAPGKNTLIHIQSINLVVRYFDQMYGFNVELPSQIYFNATEGLCGVCNSDVSDDLYHRSGYVTEDVEDFAYSWLDEGYMRSLCTFPREPLPSPPPPSLCNFTANACELFLEPDAYLRSCRNDVSFSRRPDAAMCRSKFQYAEQCCERGVSLEQWLVQSGCDYACSVGLVFTCTSACPQTCDNYKTYQADACDMLDLYTCACPPGQVYKLGLARRCVDVSECETCDAEGHVVGDTWSTDPCTKCECTADLTVTCTVTECPIPPICKAEETLTLLTSHSESCCVAYQCRAVERKECPSVPEPECLPGESKVLMFEDDCPKYACECKSLLCPPPVKPTAPREEGEQYLLEMIGCCQQYVSKCYPETCGSAAKCGPGFQMVTHRGKCCTQYNCIGKEDVCLFQHKFAEVNGTSVQLPMEEYYDVEYEDGSSWQDGPCTECSCMISDGAKVTCRNKMCPDASDFHDADKYIRLEESVPEACCPRYLRVKCRSNNQTFSAGESWPSPDHDKCKSYQCLQVEGGDEVIIAEKTTECDQSCPDFAVYEEAPASSEKCCGHCKPVACEEDGIVYQAGDSWESKSKPCYIAQCIVSGNTTKTLYQAIMCPAVHETCPEEDLVADSNGCCTYCKTVVESCKTIEIADQETVGYFQLIDQERGVCRNSEPLYNLTKCFGQCDSKSSYSMLMDSFESSCKCCLPVSSEKRDVSLSCEDGSRLEKIYQQPITCQCSSCSEDYSRGTIELPTPY